MNESPLRSANLIYIRADESITCEEIAECHRRGGRMPKLRGGKRFLFWGVAVAAAWFATFLVLSPLVRLIENFLRGN